jgi:hypothetical protein
MLISNKQFVLSQFMVDIKELDAQIKRLHIASIRENIVTALNVRPPSPSAYVSFLGKVAPSGAATSHWEDWANQNTKQGLLFERNYLALAPEPKLPSTPQSRWTWPETVSHNQGKKVLAAMVSSRLRTLVDEWLETGRNEEGESPTRRNIELTRSAVMEVVDFTSKYHPQFFPGFDSSFMYPLGDHKAGNVFEARDLEATRLFVNFVITDWKQSLCKCRYSKCGVYFIPKKLRATYPHGTFCKREHQRDMSALAATKARRSNAKSNLMKLAAQWIAARGPDSAGWQHDGALKDQIAKYLSAQMSRKRNLCSGRDQVTKSWVTWNCEEIETALAAL